MDRREFLRTGAAGVALSAAGGRSAWAQSREARRVGLIGCGWYGKCDLIRLMQVAPVRVVSLCDVDKAMLADAAEAGRRPAGLDRRPRGPTPTTGRCSPRRTSTSSSSTRPTTGTPCR